MARTANNLAVVLVGRDQLDRAAELYAYSSEQFGNIGSVLGVAVTRYNRGEVLLHKNQPTEALPLFSQSLMVLEKIGARNFLPEVLRLAAEASLALAMHDQAEAYAQRSLNLANELGLAVEAAIAQRVLGQIALANKQLDGATELLEVSGASLEKLDNRYELAKTRRWQAALEQARQQHQQAAKLLRQAEQIFRELDAQRDLGLVQEALRALEVRRG
jgi:tetratricopeptide (TPR) repeat protein